ncbi:MAG: bacillithiol biosynthesis deacetylase BshB1 [Leptospiraceae bacterium]|nr:bacillithiol biosynthesis deacetylase BshB1 [Leptospiraceae bacterium]MDW7976375.1 bacillithiol biosynthesis deacetylase BshB1 [Leptospiraceae bacterium]
MYRILCIGAHPDDVEMGMGGTVALLTSQGYEVLILDLTDGEPTPHGSPEIRLKEAQKAAEILRAQRLTLDMPNRYLEDTIENRKKIAKVIREFRPNYIFAPYFDDAHPDHVAASKLADAARFYAKLTKSDIPGEPFYPQRVIYYFPLHIRLRIMPSFLVDISEYLEIKRQAVYCYESQFFLSKRESILELLFLENKYWGKQANVVAAEPFFQKEIPLYKKWPLGYQ